MLERKKGKGSKDKKQPSFFILPEWRIYKEFPWQIWAVGWLAVFKAVIWLSTSPDIPSPMLEILAIKFLICIVPFIIFGFGVWNLRKWAMWGLILLCIADLLFFLIFWHASIYIIGKNFWLLAICLLLFNGPLGDVLILLTIPFLLKYAGKNYFQMTTP